MQQLKTIMTDNLPFEFALAYFLCIIIALFILIIVRPFI